MQVLKVITCLLIVMYSNMAIAKQNLSPTKARRWLQTSLAQYFADKLTMHQLTTTTYAQFKTDAMGVEFDGGMSQATFEKKWATIYDVKQPAVNQGFLIPLQDWNTIIVNCRLIYVDKQILWFTLRLTETTNDAYYSRYIKLVPVNGNYRIDDVLETMPKYEYQEYVAGDFNGDRKADTLTVAFISRINNRPIVIDTALSYDSLITTVVNKKPLLQLMALGWRPLVLKPGNDHVLGVDLLKNIGNINKIPGDEIAVIVQGADWSNSNVCLIYSYNKQHWIKIKTIEIREENLKDIISGKIKPWNR